MTIASASNTFTPEDYVDLASSATGTTVLAVSDEFFAKASNMINPADPVRYPFTFDDNGAVMDGWETRRHNRSGRDWAVLRLGFPGTLAGFDIDTTFFNGNHAPEASVEGCFAPNDTNENENENETTDYNDANKYQWVTILEKTVLKGNSPNRFALPKESTQVFTHLRLNNYPDGGITRFRAYGTVRPTWTSAALAQDEQIDLAFIGNGAQVVACSDEHFGRKSNLILPGRGANMGDGWETKRSREANHSDWATIKLGAAGRLQRAEIDTCHFKGNFPESFNLEACSVLDSDGVDVTSDKVEWWTVCERSPLSAHKQHYFDLVNADKTATHVRLTIFPDGGVKRVRIWGQRVSSD
ncbi:allantoicase [Ramicandelaber brevisporus]|nr:allantoicase [Ramicandelaber brevisporus]